MPFSEGRESRVLITWLEKTNLICSCAFRCQLTYFISRREEQDECSEMAMAIFTSRPNSHPFEERRVPFTERVKIGRSVAKSRPASNNCIFDCKVLSRNHAILWYEDGKVSVFLPLIQQLMFTSWSCVRSLMNSLMYKDINGCLSKCKYTSVQSGFVAKVASYIL